MDRADRAAEQAGGLAKGPAGKGAMHGSPGQTVHSVLIRPGADGASPLL